MWYNSWVGEGRESWHNGDDDRGLGVLKKRLSESHYQFKYTTIVNERINDGNLKGLYVLLPSPTLLASSHSIHFRPRFQRGFIILPVAVFDDIINGEELLMTGLNLIFHYAAEAPTLSYVVLFASFRAWIWLQKHSTFVNISVLTLARSLPLARFDLFSKTFSIDF